MCGGLIVFVYTIFITLFYITIFTHTRAPTTYVEGTVAMYVARNLSHEGRDALKFEKRTHLNGTSHGTPASRPNHTVWVASSRARI